MSARVQITLFLVVLPFVFSSLCFSSVVVVVTFRASIISLSTLPILLSIYNDFFFSSLSLRLPHLCLLFFSSYSKAFVDISVEEIKRIGLSKAYECSAQLSVCNQGDEQRKPTRTTTNRKGNVSTQNGIERYREKDREGREKSFKGKNHFVDCIYS